MSIPRDTSRSDDAPGYVIAGPSLAMGPGAAALLALQSSSSAAAPGNVPYEAIKAYDGAPEPPTIPAGLTPEQATAFIAAENGAHVVGEQTSGLYLAATLN